MKTEATSKTAVPMLHVTLPDEIILPANADINALMRVLAGAMLVNKISDIEVDGRRTFDGSYTYYTSPGAIPTIEPAPRDKRVIFDSEEKAIEARIENVIKYREQHEKPAA